MTDRKTIVGELIDVRQRGVDRLDVNTGQQPRKLVPSLERLARDYCEAAGSVPTGRIAQITKLLRDGLTAYADRTASAKFIEDLLFDPPGTATPQTPGKRLLLP